MMSGALLEDRGVIEVGGPEAGALLQRLVTNDVLDLEEGGARYAALLTPQGKIWSDFIGVRTAAGFLLDCPRDLAHDLAKKLTMYRLRAQVTIADRSAEFFVAAFWPDRPAWPATEAVMFKDPRHDALGWRMIADGTGLLAALAGSSGDYQRHRILTGVPQGGIDFAYGETFPHEANLDRLHGVDFKKGCYVGQEVVSRVEHRGTARKRIAPVSFEGEAPPLGSDILVGEIAIGTMGSGLPGHGLAMVRIDRAAAAAAAGERASAQGKQLLIALP